MGWLAGLDTVFSIIHMYMCSNVNYFEIDVLKKKRTDYHPVRIKKRFEPPFEEKILESEVSYKEWKRTY